MNAHSTWSNEARIQRALDSVGCGPTNFCKLVGCGRTRFQEAMNGTGRGFDDEEAQRYLSFLERLHDLQSAINETTRDPETGVTASIPLDFTRVEAIGNALATRLAQKICLEDGDHALDEAANRAVGELRRGSSGVK